MDGSARARRVAAAAREAAAELARRPGPIDVAFVACSYDTDFEPVDAQLRGRVEQLRAAYGEAGAVRWSLWVVDDAPEGSRFGDAVTAAFDACAPALRAAGRLRTVATPRSGAGAKGRAILLGMRAALAAEPFPSAVAYLNLNLKVDAALSSLGLLPVLGGYCDACIGSRARRDGGARIGAGLAGRVKSGVFNAAARLLLPPLRPYADTNAPLKVFSPPAARHLLVNARIPGVTMDCEWLVLLHAAGYRVQRFPVVWRQRAGSRPPWRLALPSLADLVRIRWRQR
ncbi:MAG: glycosyltransferase family protein [Planctomycetota bacterium]|jgi:hypothetical protein